MGRQAMTRFDSDAPWIFEGDHSAGSASKPAAETPVASFPVEARPATRWPPGLVLDCWLMVACFFLVGLGEGDKYVFLSAIYQSYPNILDKGMAYKGNFCFTLHENFNVLTAVPELCQVLGAFLAVVLAARKGRRLSLWVSLMLYALSRLLQLTAFVIEQFFAAAFLLALANGIMLQVTVVDMIEIAPFLSRGSLIAGLFFGQYLGTLCGNLLSFGLSSLTQKWAWRVVPAYSLWITMLLMVLLKGLPETPANLLKSGRIAEGRAALQEIRGYLADIEEEFSTMLETTRTGNAVMPQLRAFKRDSISRIALLTALSCMLVLPALNVLAVYDSAKYILLHLLLDRNFDGNDSTSSSQLLTMDTATSALAQQVQSRMVRANITALVLQQSAQVIGTLLAIAGADPLGRCRGTMLAFALAGFWSLVVSLIVHAGQSNPGTAAAAMVWAAAAFVLLTEVFSSAGFILVYTYLIEIQPMQTRVLACSLTIMVRGLHLFLWQVVFFRWMCSMSSWAIFLGGSLLTLSVAVVARLFMLETSNCRTEDISKLWRSHWAWKRCVGAPALSAFSDKG